MGILIDMIVDFFFRIIEKYIPAVGAYIRWNISGRKVAFESFKKNKVIDITIGVIVIIMIPIGMYYLISRLYF